MTGVDAAEAVAAMACAENAGVCEAKGSLNAGAAGAGATASLGASRC
jgi:hypothetical protein